MEARQQGRKAGPLVLGHGWVEVWSKAAWHRALALARGRYQDGLLRGYEAYSGRTRRGEGGDWGSQRRKSRDALLERMTRAGIPWSIREDEDTKRKILVIGEPPEEKEDAA